jgi:hypothetical protein
MSDENENKNKVNENVQEKNITKTQIAFMFIFAILLMVVLIYTNRLNRKIIKMQDASLGIYIGILCLYLVLIYYCIKNECKSMILIKGLIGLSIFAEMGTLIASIYKINRNELVDDTLSSNEIEKILKTNRILISVYSISIGIYGLYEFRNFSRRDCITTNEYNML